MPLTENINRVTVANTSAKSLVGFSSSEISQRCPKHLHSLSAFSVPALWWAVWEHLRVRRYTFEAGTANPVQSATLGLAAFGGGYLNRYSKEAPMPNHTPVAPATSENTKAPQYRSLADYAKGGLYLLEELDEISGILHLLTETCYAHYEDELGNALTALTLINKSQDSLYKQLKEKLQTLSKKTAGLQYQGAPHAS